jgi:CheY-like chemotaxis protein
MLTITINVAKIKAIFVLEDSADRIAWFEKQFKDVPTVIITKDVNVALESLRVTKFDLIFLDHDLEDISIYEEDFYTGPNGVDVAKEIRDTINRKTECIVHSMNPIGAANIIAAHPFNTYHVPYRNLMQSLKVINEQD